MNETGPGLCHTSPISQPALTQAALSFICASSAVFTCKGKALAETLCLYLAIRGDITLASSLLLGYLRASLCGVCIHASVYLSLKEPQSVMQIE